ncbi:hypothetical protein KOR42_24270 [Thalassoglobus neptunius]|uniref:Uncharacterized protein n=1 Tax=Thalassoglobus neptunius TaxID=1938619 RepID=A0A5C5X874_9PLAN|nr:hypothetical protein [Thalassoglobus neptunius]TWT59038.1 hypothetical protein KOR42_24270 [Thalassoglobus neptunius]
MDSPHAPEPVHIDERNVRSCDSLLIPNEPQLDRQTRSTLVGEEESNHSRGFYDISGRNDDSRKKGPLPHHERQPFNMTKS